MNAAMPPRTESLGVLEIVGLTTTMVAIDAMTKAAAVRVLQMELNDAYGVCVKVGGAISAVQTAAPAGREAVAQMRGQVVVDVLARVAPEAWPAIFSAREFNPLIQQEVVFEDDSVHPDDVPAKSTRRKRLSSASETPPMALGFIETQGFTAVINAIDTACKAAGVEVVGKEKLGGGYITVVIQGELSAVTSAVEAGRERVESLGKLIAAHIIARPNRAILSLLPKVVP